MNKKDKILHMLRLAKHEVNQYRKTKNELWLYQASEKLWTAYVLLIELLSGKELKSRKEIDKTSWRLISKGELLRDVYIKANTLHVYHYEGRLSTRIVLEHIKFLTKMIKLHLR